MGCTKLLRALLYNGTFCTNAHKAECYLVHWFQYITRALPLPRTHLHLVAPEEGGCGLGSGLGLRAVLAHHVQDHVVVLGVIPRAHGQRCAQAQRPANPAGAATHSANLLDRFQWEMSRATDDLKWGLEGIQKFEIFVFSLIYPDVWTRLCVTARWCLQPPPDSPDFGGRRKKISQQLILVSQGGDCWRLRGSRHRFCIEWLSSVKTALAAEESCFTLPQRHPVIIAC